MRIARMRGEHPRSMLANTGNGEVCQHDRETLLKNTQRHEAQIEIGNH